MNLIQELKKRLGFVSESKPMVFPIGEGLSEREKLNAEIKTRLLVKQAPTPTLQTDTGTYVANAIREVIGAKSIARLGMKKLGIEEWYPGLGIPLEGGKKVSGPGISKIAEQFIFGTEKLEVPQGKLKTGIEFVGAIPIIGGLGKTIAKETTEKLVAKFGKEVAEEIIKKGGKELGEKAIKEGGEKIVTQVLKKEVKPIITTAGKITTKEVSDIISQKTIKEVAQELEEGTLKKITGLKAIKVSEQAAQDIIRSVEKLQPELKAIKGKPLTYIEVKEAAKTSDILTKVTTRADTLRVEAKIQATKADLAALAEGKGVSPDFIKELQAVSAEATNAGRVLNSLKIEAMPEYAVTKSAIIKKLLDVGYKLDEIVGAAKGVDFTDMNQATKFYRKFIKPEFLDAIDEFRYINLLSSPKTHIVNAFTNLLQATILNPVTKLASGGIDMIASGLRGAQRTHYLKEVPAYYRGTFNAVGDAVKDTLRVLGGQSQIYRPDVKRIPTNLKILRPFQIVPKMMEAADVFFRTLIMGGEKEALAYRAIKQGEKASPELINKIEKEAADKAQYYVFRQILGAKNQGYLLSEIDKVTQSIYTLRGGKYNPIKWFIPFVTTPMNILKQGIEYSPLGFTTVIGAADKTEQIAKAFVGSTVFAGAGYIAMTGGSTWSPPSNAKEKEYFYASGKQPYSLKIGDNWVSYSRLGPLAYPIAMAAAIKWFTDDNPSSNTDDTLAKTTRILGGIGGFFSDQSYIQGIGNFVDSLRGDDYAIGQALANLPSQLIPMQGLIRWINNYFIDPVYRKSKSGLSIESVIQNIEKGIPFLSKTLPAYTEPLGAPSERKSPILNAFSPIGVTENIRGYSNMYNLMMDKKKLNSIKVQLKKRLQEKIESKLNR